MHACGHGDYSTKGFAMTASYISDYIHERDMIKRAVAQRLEEAGVLYFESTDDHGSLRRYYERIHTLKELQIPKDIPKAYQITAQRMCLAGKWRLMYDLNAIMRMLEDSPTFEGKAKRQRAAEHKLRLALLDCLHEFDNIDVVSDIIADTFTTFRGDLRQSHRDDIDWDV
jgi:hypothetical protein